MLSRRRSLPRVGAGGGAPVATVLSRKMRHGTLAFEKEANSSCGYSAPETVLSSVEKNDEPNNNGPGPRTVLSSGLIVFHQAKRARIVCPSSALFLISNLHHLLNKYCYVGAVSYL